VSGFLAHTGPIARIGPTRLRLEMARRHLNFGGRLHGGMVMTTMCAAAESVARDTAGAAVELVTLDVQFMVAQRGPALVEAEVECSRCTRTLVFLRVVLSSAGNCLATASAIYRVSARPSIPPALAEPPSREGWGLVQWNEPFSEHVGALYERKREDGLTDALFQVDATRMAGHAPVLHDGMSLFVADIFCGRAARAAAGGRCVTLAMQARRFGDVPLGDWAELVPAVRHGGDSVLHVDGTLRCGGRPVLAIASAWKLLGAT
jgi:acyl-coenzyme A thioesterase PaaI-like protein